MMDKFVAIPSIFSFLLSLSITSITIMIYRGLGIVDRSTSRDHPKNIHLVPVPRGGGIPIFLAVTLTVVLFIPMSTQVVAMLLGAMILMLTGVFDDIFDLSPYLRIVVGVIAGVIGAGGGVAIRYVSNPMGGVPIEFGEFMWIANLVSILWIVWAMNFVNMGAKGLDGQLPGVVVIAAIVMGIMSLRFAPDIGALEASFMSFAVAGAYGGLLVFNAYPQKIMPGWGAGSQAGYLLAVISMLSGAKLATALIVLGIPLMDVIYAIMRRIRRGKSPVWGDAEHLHHRLLEIGFTKRQVAGIYWLFSAILGLVALQLNSQMKIYTIFLLAIAIGGILLWINYFLSSNRSE